MYLEDEPLSGVGCKDRTGRTQDGDSTSCVATNTGATDCAELVASLSVTPCHAVGGGDVRPAFTSSLMLGNGYFGDRGRFDAGSFGGVMQANARLESRKRRRSGSWLSVGFGRRVLVGLERSS